ncbi:PREDICTED: poly(A)-specific ribonuclease PARN-like domain-containing protein 1 [Galeopterus variegatus]|uniref:Poly(A)-specific ribonuclease PARN-like domain-containing protein 1 n=1 Tax=Galeopterus variegatus TaxID=482537 RepID=A0ABM0RSR2_GALVR|nr:PREDICTED: poly(A)-specific ribonuclease PARN-like domain-containing protein 1 [Galeopterus variegatus]
MDVGADEFEQSLPMLQELVLGADFVGLDIEFTGLRSNLAGPQQISLFDLPSEWYLKTRQSVQQFTVCQIGLSVFSCIEGESNKYVAHSCNFFLFPTTFGILDSEFSFQASSVQFLNQYGFNYNKFLKNGIPYMNEEQEKKIKRNILTGNWRVRSFPDKDQIKVVIDEVTQWLDLAEEGDWMTLPGIAGLRAFEVQLVLRQALPNIWTVLQDEGSESYDQFKQNIHNLFPVLIDTKNVTKDIWKELNFPRVSNLSEVYKVLNSDLNPTKNSGPVIIHARKCEKYVGMEYPHEAAYDAFLCGSVLLKVAHLLLQRLHGNSPIPEPCFSQYLHVLAPYVNQVNLIRAGVPKINFPGPDYPSIRPPILILSVRKWLGVSEQQVYHEFHNLCKFDVRRLTRSQFLLLTNKFKDLRNVLKEYRGHPTLQLSVYRYWRHSPNVNCLLQVCGIVTTWAVLAFLLGRPSP